MSESLAPIPHPVEFKPTPKIKGEGMKLIMSERRDNSKNLAKAAGQIKEARELAFKDVTTGLPNKLAFSTELPLIIKLAKEHKEPLALMMIDVTGLKRTNDQEGHESGDKLLKTVPKAFEGTLREDDIIYRIGGDEYAVLLPGYLPQSGQTEDELNESNVQRIKSTFINKSRDIGIPEELHVGLSLGITILREDDDPDSFVHRADLAEIEDHNKVYSALRNQGQVFEDERTQI